MYTTRGPASVVSADFDGDGNLDLAVLDLSSNRVTVWLGDGRGRFLTPGNVELPGPPQAGNRSPEALTAREAEVAALMARAYTDREIGTMLGIGRRTAETHAANVLAKLGLRSRRELLRRGLGLAELTAAARDSESGPKCARFQREMSA